MLMLMSRTAATRFSFENNYSHLELKSLPLVLPDFELRDWPIAKVVLFLDNYLRHGQVHSARTEC